MFSNTVRSNFQTRAQSIVNWDGPNKMAIKPKGVEVEATTNKKKKVASDLDVPVPKKFPKLEEKKETPECTGRFTIFES